MSRYAIMSTNDAIQSQAVYTTPGKLIYIGAQGSYEGTTLDLDAARFYIKVPGRHFVFAQLSFYHLYEDESDTFHVTLYKNGVSTGYKFSVQLSQYFTNLLSGSLSCILDLEVGDYLELFMHTSASPATVTVVDCQFGAFNT